MKCPVCNVDLSPLDIVSRNEHITLCLENGPSLVEYEAGQLVVKRSVPLEKQRKICPICSKTYQNILTHFKSCALKNDLIPDLMQSYWFQLNEECKTNKSFPRDLLESYIAKSVREGRVGEQVQFARELLKTIPEDAKRKRTANQAGVQQLELHSASSNLTADDSTNHSILGANADSDQSMPATMVSEDGNSALSAHDVLMRNARPQQVPAPAQAQQGRKAKTRLELASRADKRHNIDLRVERELAAPRLARYRQALRENPESTSTQTQAPPPQTTANEEVRISAEGVEREPVIECIDVESATARARNEVATTRNEDEIKNLSKYFFLARLKDCTGKEECLRGECSDHSCLDVHLALIRSSSP